MKTKKIQEQEVIAQDVVDRDEPKEEVLLGLVSVKASLRLVDLRMHDEAMTRWTPCTPCLEDCALSHRRCTLTENLVHKAPATVL
ncbi:MAG: hypothetical protein Q9174_007004 [Haloplaca sp. 1 TL-2023]